MKAGEYEERLSFVVCKVIPLYYPVMTEREKDTYIHPFLEDPLIPASFLFHTLMTSFQSGSTCVDEVILLILFMKARISSLIEEITSQSEDSTDPIYADHVDSVVNSLCHVPDILSNLFPKLSLSFFSPRVYSSWLSFHFIHICCAFFDSLDEIMIRRFLQKFCILGYTESFASSSLSFLQTLAGDRSDPLFSSLVKFNSLPELENHFRFLVTSLPSLQLAPFVRFLLTMSHPPSNRLLSLICKTIMTKRVVSLFPSILSNHSFSLPLLVRLLNHLHDESLSSFNSLLSSLFSLFGAHSFSLLSSSLQLQLASLIYCLLSLYSLESRAHQDLLTTAVGKRLGSGDAELRQVVIGVAQRVASVIAPESNLEWPAVDLRRLDAIVEECRQETGREEISPPVETEIVVPSVSLTQETQKEESRYVDPDEVIDVFEQEERNMLGIQEMEAETDSSSDDEEEFLPYDLMETPTVSSILHLDEVASSLSSDDFSKRESSWQSLRELVRSDPCDVTTIHSVLPVVLALNGIPGCTDFWSQWRDILSLFVAKQTEAAMEEVFRFVRKNSRTDMTVVKCISLLQAVSLAGTRLATGIVDEKAVEPKQMPAPVFLTGEVVEENGLIRVAQTRYKPSYYRKKLSGNTAASQSLYSSSQTSPVNLFSSRSRLLTAPLLTWGLRFPPRDEMGIATLLQTLTTLFSLPVLTSDYEAGCRDVSELILRYRFHKASPIRYRALELFVTTTRFDNTASRSPELREKEKVIEWMMGVLSDDPDDRCRSLARTILSQLREYHVCNKQKHS